jgi:hypothetical protein
LKNFKGSECRQQHPGQQQQSKNKQPRCYHNNNNEHPTTATAAATAAAVMIATASINDSLAQTRYAAVDRRQGKVKSITTASYQG